MASIRVLIADDHRLIRAGLRSVLESAPGIDVIADVGSGEAAVEKVRSLVPDVVLMDVNMPGIGGVEAARRILQHAPDARVLALSMHSDEPFPSRMLALGAMGYVSKNAAPEEVIEAVRRVHGGDHYISSDVASRMASVLSGKAKSPFAALSEREMQIVIMTIGGDSPTQIAKSLNLSPKTISTYRTRLFDKLGVDNDVALMKLALRHGLTGDVSASGERLG